MKFLFRWLFRIVVLTLLLGVALVLFKDAILEEITEQRLAARTGLEIRIDRLEVALLSPAITIEGFRIYNPAEFGGTPFLDFHELHVEYDRARLARGELELRLLRIDLDELSLVRDRQGQWNFQEISRRIKEHTPPDERFTLDFAGIDILNLSVGRVKRVDLAAPDNVQVFRADLRDELFTDLRAPGDYVLAASRLALKLGLKRLTAGTTNVPPIRASPH